MKCSDITCSERDELESEFLDLKKQHAYLESSHNAVVTERDHLNSEVSFLNNNIAVPYNIICAVI